MEGKHEQLCSYFFSLLSWSLQMIYCTVCLRAYLKVFFPFAAVAYHLYSKFPECWDLLLEQKSFTPVLHKRYTRCVQRKKELGGSRYAILLQLSKVCGHQKLRYTEEQTYLISHPLRLLSTAMLIILGL